jgi:hypothetical protein
MALAFGHFGDGSFFSGNGSWTHDCTGDSVLFVWLNSHSGSPVTFTSVTFNGVAMTALATNVNTTHYNGMTLYMLLNPASGSHTIAVNQSTSLTLLASSTSYSGSATSSAIGASTYGAEVASGSGIFTLPITTTTANSWVVAFTWNGEAGNTFTSGTSLTTRGHASGGGFGSYDWDSNVALSAGVQLLVGNDSATEFVAYFIVELLVAAAAPSRAVFAVPTPLDGTGIGGSFFPNPLR